MAEARQLRAEAAQLEKELGLVDESCECGGAGCPSCGGATLLADTKTLASTTKNNILSFAKGPKWKTQIRLGDENDRPILRTGWTLLDGGSAHVEAGVSDVERNGGWRLVGDAKEKLFESWFWVEGAADAPPTKFVLKTTATPQAECETLLGYERQAKEHLEKCQQRIRDADAEDASAQNPLAWVLKLHERTLAVDELLSARQVMKEYEHHAERAKGATISLDGVLYTLGGKGAVVASKGEGPPRGRGHGSSEQTGSFSSWLASR
jgi:hypothetical protein